MISLLYSAATFTLLIVPMFFMMICVISPFWGIASIIATLLLLVYCLWKRPKGTLQTLAFLFITATLIFWVIGIFTDVDCNTPGHLDYHARQIKPGMTSNDVSLLIPSEFEGTSDRAHAMNRVNTLLNPERPPIVFSRWYFEHCNGMHALKVYFDENCIVVGYLLECGGEWPVEDKNTIELPGVIN